MAVIIPSESNGTVSAVAVSPISTLLAFGWAYGKPAHLLYLPLSVSIGAGDSTFSSQGLPWGLSQCIWRTALFGAGTSCRQCKQTIAGFQSSIACSAVHHSHAMTAAGKLPVCTGLREWSMRNALGFDPSIDSSTYNGVEEFVNDPTGPGAIFYKVIMEPHMLLLLCMHCCQHR